MFVRDAFASDATWSEANVASRAPRCSAFHFQFARTRARCSVRQLQDWEEDCAQRTFSPLTYCRLTLWSSTYFTQCVWESHRLYLREWCNMERSECCVMSAPILCSSVSICKNSSIRPHYVNVSLKPFDLHRSVAWYLGSKYVSSSPQQVSWIHATTSIPNLIKYYPLQSPKIPIPEKGTVDRKIP